MLTVFRDDFDGPALGAGWTIEGSAELPVSLTDRPGFLRIFPQALPVEGPAEPPGVLTRELEGDFVVTTRMQFEPLLDFQLGGVIVMGPDQDRLVTFGLISASGPRGTFQGLLLRADRGPDVAPGRAAVPFSGDEVFLRVERRGSTFVSSFSEDGANFVTVGSVSNDLPGVVQVGLGAIKGESCGEHCDQLLPADFDFFEVSVPADNGPS